jgi:hypothetical protein
MRPPVFTFHPGDFPIERIRRLQSLGITVGGSATPSVKGQRPAVFGVDFFYRRIRCQGGGQRGTYLRDPDNP